MNWKSVILIALVCVVTSCNKFEHTTFTLPNCELCDYAETLEGTYRGLAGGLSVPNYADSVTITVEQVFANNSQYEDSTLIRLNVDYNFDSSGIIRVHTIQLLNSSGKCKANMADVYGPSGMQSGTVYYQFVQDSLKITYTNYTGSSGSWYQYFGGKFKKQ